jgi:dTDP-4-dehydrorhamnose reductase
LSTRIRIAVTGKSGQVARSLRDVGAEFGADICLVGRPELDLTMPQTVLRALKSTAPHVIVNAAAYTAVDQAEREPAAAWALNESGARAVAAAGRALDVPVIHLSTDYVFNGRKRAPYIEEDPPAPTSVYGVSKLAGERAVAATTTDYVILRTSWVFSPYGKNFVRTMVELAGKREEVRVVADQQGCPSYARDLAVAIIFIAKRLLENPADARLRGTFHLAGTGQTTWDNFADAIFSFLESIGRDSPVVKPITSAEYPTAARRPANSRLDCGKIARTFGLRMPAWPDSLRACLEVLCATSVSSQRVLEL